MNQAPSYFSGIGRGMPHLWIRTFARERHAMKNVPRLVYQCRYASQGLAHIVCHNETLFICFIELISIHFTLPVATPQTLPLTTLWLINSLIRRNAINLLTIAFYTHTPEGY